MGVKILIPLYFKKNWGKIRKKPKKDGYCGVKLQKYTRKSDFLGGEGQNGAFGGGGAKWSTVH